MPHVGKHILAEQAGKWGYYCELELHVDCREGPNGLAVSFDESIETEWRMAAGFGVAYAWERLPWSGEVKKFYDVSISRVKTQPVDTKTMCVAYSAAKAFWEAVGFVAPDGFRLDANSGIFCVPK